jgi:hypothetical protein
MKHQNSCGPRWCKLVHQLPGVVTFAYDLRLGRTIANWKDIDEKIHLGGSIRTLSHLEAPDMKKHCLGPQNGPKSLGVLVTYPLPQSNFSLISAESEPPNYLWRPSVS